MSERMRLRWPGCAALVFLSPGVCAADQDRSEPSAQLARYEQLMGFDELAGLAGAVVQWDESADRFRYAPVGIEGAATHEVEVRGDVVRTTTPRVEADPAAPRIVRSLFPSTAPPLLEVRSPDRERFLTLRGANLAVRRAGEDEIALLTSDAAAGLEWTTRGAQWSPDGRWAAAVQIDERRVNHVPVVSWLGDQNAVSMHPYPQARGAFAQPRLAIIEARSGRIVRPETGADDHFISIAGFHADSAALRFLRMTRDHGRTDLMEFDLSSGVVRRVMSETSATYLYGSEDVFASRRFYTPLQDGRFVWASERDGWNHLYLYDGRGRLLRRLTRGAFPVIDVRHVDEASGTVYFSAHPDARRPYDRHLLRVRLDGSELEQLTQEPGVHEISFSPDGAHYVDVHSSVRRPPAIELRTAEGELRAVVERADASRLYELGWSAPEEFVVKAADGETELHGRLYKPIGFDPRRRYPVVQLIYAGAFKSIVPNGFRPSNDRVKFLQALAQLGFIGVVLDARGTPGRSKAFQNAAHESFGRHEIADHSAALERLAASRPYMDTSRVGLFGISYGGYFTIRGMLQRPDLYDVGVALAPAEIDPEVLGPAIEPLLGSPGDNPAGYAAAANAALAANLRGRLLLVGATSDVNTPFAQTLKIAEALRKAGATPDMLVIPDANHLMRRAGGESVMRYVFDVTRDYLVEHLHPAPVTAEP